MTSTFNLFGQHPVELLGLVRRTGKAVENVAFRVFVRRDIVGDHVDHHLVGSESARGDIGLHLFAEFRPRAISSRITLPVDT